MRENIYAWLKVKGEDSQNTQGPLANWDINPSLLPNLTHPGLFTVNSCKLSLAGLEVH